MTPNVGRSSAELRPNSLMLPSRTEPNIRPNPSAELRRLPKFGPSLLWNSLSEQLRQPDITFGQFKQSLKTFMFD